MSRSNLAAPRPKNYLIAKSVDVNILDMQSEEEDGASWNSGVGGTRSVTTAAPYKNEVIQNVLTLEADTTASDCHSRYTYAANQDWSKHPGVGFSVYFDQPDTLQYASILIRDGASNSLTFTMNAGQFTQGWVLFAALFTEMTNTGIDLTDIHDIRVLFHKVADDPGQLMYYTDLFVYHGTRTVAMFSFDDGPDADYTGAFTVLQEEGFVGTSYVYPGELGQSADRGGNWLSGKLTDAQMDEMYAAGWDFGNHSWTGGSFSGQTEAEVTEELALTRDWLLEHFPRAARHVAYPGGFRDETVIAAMQATGMLSGRTASTVDISRFKASSKLVSDMFGLYTINHGYIDTAGGVADMQAFLDLIDDAIAEQQPILIYGHRVETPAGTFLTTTEADLRIIAAHVKWRLNQGLVSAVSTISRFYKDSVLLL